MDKLKFYIIALGLMLLWAGFVLGFGLAVLFKLINIA